MPLIVVTSTMAGWFRPVAAMLMARLSIRLISLQSALKKWR
jgi:hypothetical protein